MIAPTSPRIYPGVVIHVDDIDEFFCLDADKVQTIKPLPPGVPLDEDIANVVFQTVSWCCECKELSIGPPYEIPDIWVRNIELSYMEAMYRWIKNKKK